MQNSFTKVLTTLIFFFCLTKLGYAAQLENRIEALENTLVELKKHEASLEDPALADRLVARIDVALGRLDVLEGDLKNCIFDTVSDQITYKTVVIYGLPCALAYAMSGMIAIEGHSRKGLVYNLYATGLILSSATAGVLCGNIIPRYFVTRTPELQRLEDLERRLQVVKSELNRLKSHLL